jgi:hypothetical protein
MTAREGVEIAVRDEGFVQILGTGILLVIVVAADVGKAVGGDGHTPVTISPR